MLEVLFDPNRFYYTVRLNELYCDIIASDSLKNEQNNLYLDLFKIGREV